MILTLAGATSERARSSPVIHPLLSASSIANSSSSKMACSCTMKTWKSTSLSFLPPSSPNHLSMNGSRLQLRAHAQMCNLQAFSEVGLV